MLTPARIGSAPLFHPVGNTPAVSLTQQIPPDRPVDILSLGCGDVRHILFTNYVDGRTMDITCCDIQKAIIARNVLLLSLAIDDEDGKNDESIWAIYYHYTLDTNSLDLLRAQSKKLYKLSSTMHDWEQSEYGTKLRFCDSATLSDVRNMWKSYDVKREDDDASKVEKYFSTALEKGMALYTSIPVPDIRSAFPAIVEDATKSLDDLSKHFLKYGTTELNQNIQREATHPNPMFLTLDDGAVLVPGGGPLTSFHLSPAFIPLEQDTQSSQKKTLPEKIVRTARMEFSQWIESYRKRSDGITLRFLVGDAISFAHTLKRQQTITTESANLYRYQNCLQPMVLDGPDYTSGAAPLSFDVIETSSLCDVLGPQTLLVAISPLLRSHAASVLYTETLESDHYSYYDKVIEILCGEVPTLSVLLGLFPVEYWTNTSPLSYGDEEEASMPLDKMKETYGPNARRVEKFLRMCWKRPPCVNRSSSPCLGLMKIGFNPQQLAVALYKVHEEIVSENTSKSGGHPNAYSQSYAVWYRYNYAAFASFLRLVKTRTTCDWDLVMRSLMGLIEKETGKGIVQPIELIAYLYMFGVVSTDVMKEWESQSIMEQPVLAPSKKWKAMTSWKDVPPVVCITLEIPRKQLATARIMNADKNHALVAMHCRLDIPNHTGPSENTFQVCQFGFGEVSTTGTPFTNGFNISVSEDSQGWDGKSPLIVSFYVPSFVLFLKPQNAEVACAIHGLKMKPFDLYKTALDKSGKVRISRYAPNQTGFPVASGFASEDFVSPGDINPGTDTSVAAVIDKKTGQVSTFNGRFNIESAEYRSALREASEVRASNISPCEISVSLGKGKPSFALSFPMFVVAGTLKAMSDKSSSIGVIAPAAGYAGWIRYPSFMYTTYLENGEPVNWNIPYLDLDKCPVISTEDRSQLGWLKSHTTSVFSRQEKDFEKDDRLLRDGREQIRINFKSTLCYTLFHGFAFRNLRALQLSSQDDGKAHMLLLPSSMRLDLSNRTIVLDAAIVPLHAGVPLSAIRKSFQSQPKSHHAPSQIQDHGVSKDELQIWKRALPAYVERCRRSWSHRGPGCAYVGAGAVPPPPPPPPTSLEGQDSLSLCTCGHGQQQQFPPRYVKGVDWWEDDVAKHAVRAAISLPFPAPFLEDECRACSRNREMIGRDLLPCDRCMGVRYCSEKCQRDDWEKHKSICI
ncbi:hypothetical protein GGS26DRAFT_594940 [Hypomontagnella submonticulosa]|nr:hypothetical protein GGS26DRAFT_594940 [Hypomontagnella submonticulosa]